VIALRRVHDHIDRHYAEPLTLSDLAALVGMSKFHPNLTVTEICMLVGFTSLGSFSAKFTDLVGESPVAYRNRWADQGPHIPGCYLFMRGVTPQFRRSPGDARRRSVEP
jgi:AraC-like DNA-binding protein